MGGRAVRWLSVGACLAAVAGPLAVAGSAGGAPSTWPYIAGTWGTRSTDCPGECGANWTFSPVTSGEAPPYAYNIFMGGVGKGFFADNVTVAANGTASFRETCEGLHGLLPDHRHVLDRGRQEHVLRNLAAVQPSLQRARGAGRTGRSDRRDLGKAAHGRSCAGGAERLLGLAHGQVQANLHGVDQVAQARKPGGEEGRGARARQEARPPPLA